MSFHRDFKASASDARLTALRAGLAAHASSEREELRRFLADVDRSRFLARQMLRNAPHLTMTRSGALSREEAAAAQSMIQVVDAHHEKALLLLDTSACRANGCAEAHASAHALIRVQAEARQADLFHLIEQAASRVSKQLSSELDRFQGVLADLNRWRKAARQALTDIEHLPLTRAGALAEREAEAVRGLIDVYDANIQAAWAFHPSLCETGGCAALHQPVAALCAYRPKQSPLATENSSWGSPKGLPGQLLAERKQLAVALADLDVWCSASVQALYGAEHMP